MAYEWPTHPTRSTLHIKHSNALTVEFVYINAERLLLTPHDLFVPTACGMDATETPSYSAERTSQKNISRNSLVQLCAC